MILQSEFDQSNRSRLRILLTTLVIVSAVALYVALKTERGNVTIPIQNIAKEKNMGDASTPLSNEDAAQQAKVIQEKTAAGTLFAEDAKKQLDTIASKLPPPPPAPEVKQ